MAKITLYEKHNEAISTEELLAALADGNYERTPYERHNESIGAEEFLAALADDNYAWVKLVDCLITGEVDISKARIQPDANKRYRINKALECEKCKFEERVNFNEADFQMKVDLGGTTFKKQADFNGTTFRGKAYFAHAVFKDYVGFHNSFEEDSRKTSFEASANFAGVEFKKMASFQYAVFKEDAEFVEAIFGGEADFGGTTFSENGLRRTNFMKATFKEKADFSHAIIEKDYIDFSDATFCGDVSFNEATFRGSAYFTGVTYKKPAYFDGVSYPSITICGSICQWWNEIRGRQQYNFETAREFIYEGTAPLFRRFVADLQYIRALKRKHRVWSWLWCLTCNFGQSIGLLASWSFIIVTFFALAYAHKDYEWIDWVLGLLWVMCFIASLRYIWTSVMGEIPKDLWEKIMVHIRGEEVNIPGISKGSPAYELIRRISGGIRKPKNLSQEARERRDMRQNIISKIRNAINKEWKTCLKACLFIISVSVIGWSIRYLDFDVGTEGSKITSYLNLSFVTFTKFGSSGVRPTTAVANIWLMTEAVLGYIMLAGLISIFANKLARRS